MIGESYGAGGSGRENGYLVVVSNAVHSGAGAPARRQGWIFLLDNLPLLPMRVFPLSVNLGHILDDDDKKGKI